MTRRTIHAACVGFVLVVGAAATLVYQRAERRDQPVTNDDLRILLKTDELLKDESVWNRKDDRECDDDEATGKRSLFCALQKACMNAPRLSCRRSAANRLNHEWISRKTSHAV